MGRFYKCIFEAFANFFISGDILASFGKNTLETSPGKFFFKFQASHFTIDFSALVNVFKFEPLYLTFAIILFLKPYISRKSIIFVTNYCLVV